MGRRPRSAALPSQPEADAAYYHRFYESRRTQVLGKAQVDHLARGVTELMAWFGSELRSALDVGAGTGMWRDWFAAHKPGVRYVSIEKSAYACERYGHLRRDIAAWRGRSRFDLIVCQGVLPYLEDAEVGSAIDNMASMCRGFLYLEATTTRDFREHCDNSRTDLSMRSRSAAFYRRHLDRHFVTVGAGLYYIKTGSLVFYDLECLRR